MTATETKKEAAVAVKKIVVQLGRKELIIDIEDARQLQGVLNELFGEVVSPKIERVEHHYHGYPYYWNYPAIQWTTNSGIGYASSGNTIYCTANGGGINGTAAGEVHNFTDPNQHILSLEVK